MKTIYITPRHSFYIAPSFLVLISIPPAPHGLALGEFEFDIPRTRQQECPCGY